jgi:hypothetical protein
MWALIVKLWKKLVQECVKCLEKHGNHVEKNTTLFVIGTKSHAAFVTQFSTAINITEMLTL